MEYSFPADFDPAAKDLVEKLLVKDLDKRLGAGLPGSQYDFKNLKAHPFFKGIDFENINSMQPPIKVKSKSFMDVLPSKNEGFEM
jgi:3-phosphoinositide dependent protein kinase-1